MKIKGIIIFNSLLVLVSSILLIFVINNQKEAKLDLVEINDIKQTLIKEWDTLDDGELPGLEYGLDYVVLDQENQVIAVTRDGLNTDINSAIQNRDTIVDLTSNDMSVGKLIIYNNSDHYYSEYKNTVLIVSLMTVLLGMAVTIVYSLYLKRVIIKPFIKLQGFARQVALGNLDLPLEMDKGNHFGAFTESFDLMRDELKQAKENERMANQSKKELVASLSHDIKTPVASIIAVSEIMSAKSESEYDKRQLGVIIAKADHINTLITNLFNATLEELQELKVEATEESSLVIEDIITESDYNHQVQFKNTAACIVLMDRLRLSQVIDNVISNSYKYANTRIEVNISINDNYLEIEFKDFGKGVLNDEIPLLFNKFYRGQNGKGKNGSGLGLYISNYLMNKMSGDMECENTTDGFITRLKLFII